MQRISFNRGAYIMRQAAIVGGIDLAKVRVVENFKDSDFSIQYDGEIDRSKIPAAESALGMAITIENI